MKYADVTPIHKKADKTDKTNYRPVSILPNLSKAYERLMYSQIFPYFDSVFSKFQCGFRKRFNLQHCLLTMVEKWRKTLKVDDETEAVLTDLSTGLEKLRARCLSSENAKPPNRARFFGADNLPSKKEENIRSKIDNII